MQIAIVGYGKMGKRIEQLAKEQGHDIICRISSANRDELYKLKSDCVAIEFTNPDSVSSNLKDLAKQKVPTVTGTTGWNDLEESVFEIFNQNDTPLFYASNFSVGVHVFRQINKLLSKAMSNLQDYSAQIEEWHHTEKKDSPSGTAITLGLDLLKENNRYSSLAPDRKANEGELEIKGYREENITGTHTVTYKSDIDQIAITHEAFNRDGFALGAIKAAEFIQNKKGGIYTMNNLIKLDE